MSEHLTYDQIDSLILTRLTRPYAWGLGFGSGHVGLNHQLYVNGRLADFTDSPAQRTFEIVSTDYPQELTVAAVSGRYRTVDLSSELPAGVQNPPWVLRTNFSRDIKHQPGDRLAIFHNSATGPVSNVASIDREIWPPAAVHWGFGQSQFGGGGFGIDGASAPGLGVDSFGIGPFGLGADLLEIYLGVCNDGEHDVEYRVVTIDAEISSPETDSFDAAPPPTPPNSLQATNYDSQKNLLTMQVQ